MLYKDFLLLMCLQLLGYDVNPMCKELYNRFQGQQQLLNYPKRRIDIFSKARILLKRLVHQQPGNPLALCSLVLTIFPSW